MTDKVFFDSNVLVYAYDVADSRKQALAQRLLEQEGLLGSLVLSTQVLQEVYVTLTRKLIIPLPETAAVNILQALRSFTIVQVSVEVIMAAIHLSITAKLSFWDTLIIECAQLQGCKILYSEDLQDGRKFGEMTIVNPFKKDVAE